MSAKITEKIKDYFKNKKSNVYGIDKELIKAVKECFISLEGEMKEYEAVEFIQKHPDLLNFKAKDLKARFSEFAKCGWTKAQVTSAYKKYKNIMYTNLADLKDKVMIFKNLGMSANTLIKNPMLLSCPSADIKLKYMFGNLIGYRFQVPYFVQSFQKSYVRANHIKSINESVEYNLTLSERKFQKKFETSYEELKQEYPLTEKEVKEIQDQYNEFATKNNLNLIELTEDEQKTCVRRNNIRDLQKLFKAQQKEQEK